MRLRVEGLLRVSWTEMAAGDVLVVEGYDAPAYDWSDEVGVLGIGGRLFTGDVVVALGPGRPTYVSPENYGSGCPKFIVPVLSGRGVSHVDPMCVLKVAC